MEIRKIGILTPEPFQNRNEINSTFLICQLKELKNASGPSLVAN